MVKESKLLHEKLTYQIRGAVFNVYNQLGPGHKESAYLKALDQEFDRLPLKYVSEKSIPLKYLTDEIIAHYRPDRIIEEKIVLEAKAVRFIPKRFEEQLFRYLKATPYKVGFLVNFGGSKLDIRRFIYDTARKPSESHLRNPHRSA